MPAGGLHAAAGSEAVNGACHLPLRASLPNCSLSQLCGGGSGGSSGWHTGSGWHTDPRALRSPRHRHPGEGVRPGRVGSGALSTGVAKGCLWSWGRERYSPELRHQSHVLGCVCRAWLRWEALAELGMLGHGKRAALPQILPQTLPKAGSPSGLGLAEPLDDPSLQRHLAEHHQHRGAGWPLSPAQGKSPHNPSATSSVWCSRTWPALPALPSSTDKDLVSPLPAGTGGEFVLPSTRMVAPTPSQPHSPTWVLILFLTEAGAELGMALQDPCSAQGAVG